MSGSICTGCSKKDGEGVAGAVGEVLDDGDAERHALALQLDLGLVLGGAAAGPVQPEAGDEDALVHGELDAVAAAAVSPLIAAVGRRTESGGTSAASTLCVVCRRTSAPVSWPLCTTGRYRLVSLSVSTPDCATPLAKSSSAIAGIRIR